jgi:glycosyltransferase involved in cell wall biosynthesis
VKILYHHRIRSKDGQFVHIDELIRALKGLGHEVILVGPEVVEEKKFGVEIGWASLLKRRLPGFAYELLEFTYTFWAYARLCMAVRRHRPDCLYERYNLYLPAGVWLKRSFGLPMLLEVNSPLLHERRIFRGLSLGWLAHWSETYAWRGADYVLPVSHVLAGYLAKAGVPLNRIVVIPNGANLSRFEKAPRHEEAKRRLGLAGRLVLGFTGYVREWDGLDQVVDWMKETPYGSSCHLLLVGDGPARESLEKHAREKGVESRVTITGVIAREKVADYIAAFDIALLPAQPGDDSPVITYSSPLCLSEYLAGGCAIVAPGAANLREILVDGEDAILFDPGDPCGFSRALERLCTDDAFRERLRRNARATLVKKCLTWENNAKKVVELFLSLGVQDRPSG